MREMDLALRHGQTKQYTLDNGKTTNLMARESLLTLLANITMACGSSQERKGRENTSKAMEILMWDIGITMNHQDSASK